MLPPPSSADIYTFLFAHPDGSPPTELKYVSENYTTPLIVSNVVPSSIYNVTVLVNDFPLPTKQFLSSTSVVVDHVSTLAQHDAVWFRKGVKHVLLYL